MKSKYIKIAMLSEANQNIRPSIAHIDINGDIIQSTDSFRASIIEQKKNCTFPNIRSFIPSPNIEN